MIINEGTVEGITLGWFRELGYDIVHGPTLAPDEPGAERETYGDVLLVERLRSAIERLNPSIPADAKEEALRKVLRVEGHDLITANRRFHSMLRDGVEV